MMEPLISATVPRRILPKTKGWPILTLSKGREEATEALPIEPMIRTGRTDLKFELRLTVFESLSVCFSCSFSERRRAFWEIRSLFCCFSLGKLLIKEIWAAVSWRR